ncbi:MAG: hypothetical protein H0V82_01660 [Candidatus Protochlamydia sp.]|nr:hypothetical protein [Candidatus Protochlamydia sp.]
MPLQPTLELHGIQFFNNAPDCITHFESSHWTEKALSLIQSYGTTLLAFLHKIERFIRQVDVQMHSFTHSNGVGFSHNKLIVCVHGLNADPSQFKSIINEIQKHELLETDIYIPRVIKKGNVALDEAVRPIFEEIVRWATNPGDKELVLIGISNGSRISRAIEAEIAKSERLENIKKLRFISIVGACKGSSMMNLANRIGLSWIKPKIISEEMPTDSARNQLLNHEWFNGLNNGPRREYYFIASPHDWTVPNYDSTLMEVAGHRTHYAIVPGQGHNTIEVARAKSIAEIILT